MYRLKEAKELLREHDFLVVVRKAMDGCTIRTPAVLSNGELVDGHETAITIIRGEKPGIKFTSTRDPARDEHFIAVPEYALRLFILCEATICGTVVGLDAELLRIADYSGEEVDEIESIIDDPTTEEDQQKESELIAIYAESRMQGFPPEFDDIARSRGVHEGYRLLKKFYVED